MSLSAALQKKIIAIAKTIPSLKKGDSNATYTYVSIDAYYEEVAKRCIEAGLNWIPTELDFDLHDIPDAGVVQRQQYGFTLYDSETGDIAENAIKLTISHPYQEAQTTGSSLSYAEKLLMRVLFKVVTGEKDADANTPKRRGKPQIDVESPFKKEAANDNASPAESPAATKKSATKGKQKTEVEDRNTTANAIAELDEPPWEGENEFVKNESVEGDAVNLYRKTADDLITKIEACTNSADLDQFRLDNEEGIKWLKSEAGKDSSPNKVIAEKERDRVAAVFREYFNNLNTEAA